MSEHPIVAETEAMVASDNAMVNEAIAKLEKARAEAAISSAKVKDIMDTTTTREPLLSDEVMFGDGSPADKYVDGKACRWVRAFYENLIISGELRVVKTVKPKWENGDATYRGSWECEYCHHLWRDHDSPEVGEFCCCGARIIP